MLIGIHDEDIISRCFEEWVLDHSVDADLDDPDELRCRIKAYSHYVMHLLTDFYDADQGIEWEV